jgi:hypothetical protein
MAFEFDGVGQLLHQDLPQPAPVSQDEPTGSRLVGRVIDPDVFGCGGFRVDLWWDYLERPIITYSDMLRPVRAHDRTPSAGPGGATWPANTSQSSQPDGGARLRSCDRKAAVD